MPSHHPKIATAARLQTLCKEYSELFQGAIFIGGIAVHQHLLAAGSGQDRPQNEFTHDADFLISRADFGDLRDIEEVSMTARLSKHQFSKDGFEFDVYVENANALVIPYGNAAAFSEVKNGIRVAALEHLLLLKAEAANDRKSSSKGGKDLRDLVRIVYAARQAPLRNGLLEPYLTQDHAKTITEVPRQTFLELTGNNAQAASRLQASYEREIALPCILSSPLPDGVRRRLETHAPTR